MMEDRKAQIAAAIFARQNDEPVVYHSESPHRAAGTAIGTRERGAVRRELARRLVESDGALDMSGYLAMDDQQLARTAQLAGVV